MGVSQARVGESKAQCAVRYGPPVAEVAALLTRASSVSYQKGEIRIRIEFLEEKAAFISFSKRGLRSEEKETLLELNGGTLIWNASAEFLGRTCWTAPARGDQPARHAAAYLASEVNYLDLATDDWARSMRAQQAVQFAIKPPPQALAIDLPAASPTPAPAVGAKLEGF